MKYKIKQPSLSNKEEHDLVCISCGKRKPVVIIMLRINGKLIRPNTTRKVTTGLIGPRPGTWLGCKLGSHDYYFDYEVEQI